ncbi:MAG: DUF4143 domain-containing protein [Candidatus Parcubacteria bacterium]|nr:DUF4143 domain-containing protein [Candidatus Paceibacterota bacterium]
MYFWDLGIRNSFLERFNQLNLRGDIGALWENFCVSERFKYNYNNQKYGKYYFWRTSNQNEIDFVEDVDGVLHGYEFKYNKSKMTKGSYQFTTQYPGSTLELINRENFIEFISPTITQG